VPPDDEPETIKDTLQIPPFGTPGRLWILYLQEDPIPHRECPS